ncbi:hypothetical protein FRC03_009907 [Tulasnella sp. 419]|nr:hypothetical protein FRC02_009940 [Tulasnella sp. 418]KAG8957687.1 hypothetical protein FRC03_009907 [Tulasnella sp. 419]
MSSISTNNMTSTRIYDSFKHTSGLQPFKKNSVPRHPGEEQNRVRTRRDYDQLFRRLLGNLLEVIDAEVQNIHEETGRSVEFIRTALGVSGPELKIRRSGNSYNAWVHCRMKEINEKRDEAGKERITLQEFNVTYGHEYAQLTPGERMVHVYEYRELQYTTAHQVKRAAIADNRTTVTQVRDIVHHKRSLPIDPETPAPTQLPKKKQKSKSTAPAASSEQGRKRKGRSI